MVDQKTLDAFEEMWGPFPEPVMLVNKDRTILARNELARTAGIPAGIKCFSLNAQAHGENCRQCKANQAMREKRTVCQEDDSSGARIIGYWMPLKENSEVYVHFGVGCAKAMGLSANVVATGECELVNVTDS